MRTIIVLIASGLVTLSAQPAFALACGETIVASTVLTANLLACPGDGVVIGADNVILNLNGYIIEGSGAGRGVSVSGRIGVNIVGPGVIRHFLSGVDLQDSTRTVVTDLTLVGHVDPGLGAGAGVSLANTSTSNRILGNTIYGNDSGITVGGSSSQNQFTQNTISRNFIGINNNSEAAGANSYKRNTITGHVHTGIRISSDRNMLDQNTVTENAFNDGAGILIECSVFECTHADRNVVNQNVVTRNGVGIWIGVGDNDNNVIRSNMIADNGVGVRIVGGAAATNDGNQVTTNTLSDNGSQIEDTGFGTVIVGNICDPPC